VGDNLENLSWVVKRACQHAQLVIISGGLGPTEDDLTREAVATALKKELVFREEIVESLRAYFRLRGVRMPEINTRQAFVIEGAEILENTVGSAPGQYLDEGHCRILLFPGPPNELVPMFESALAARIEPLSNFFIYSRTLKLAGISESAADSLLAPIYSPYANPMTTILASPGVIEIHLLGRSRNSIDEARRLTDELEEKLAAAAAQFLITRDDRSQEEVVVSALREKGLSLGVAESCTGGGLGALITSVPGSSEVFRGGIIAYDNAVKESLLGVSPATLERFGAVSAETARAMAVGVRGCTGAALGIAITGIAGPGGGSVEKPVGLVHIALSDGDVHREERHLFSGDRPIIRTRAARQALTMIFRYLHGRSPEPDPR